MELRIYGNTKIDQIFNDYQSAKDACEMECGKSLIWGSEAGDIMLGRTTEDFLFGLPDYAEVPRYTIQPTLPDAVESEE